MTTDQSQSEEQILQSAEEELRLKTKELFQQEFKTSFDYLTDEQLDQCSDKMVVFLDVVTDEGGFPDEDEEPSERLQTTVDEFQTYFHELHAKSTDDATMAEKMDEIDQIVDRVVEKLHEHCNEQAFQNINEFLGPSDDPESVTLGVMIGGFGMSEDKYIENPALINRTGTEH